MIFLYWATLTLYWQHMTSFTIPTILCHVICAWQVQCNINMHHKCVRGISLFFQCFAFLQASDHLEPFEVAGGTAKPEPAISLSFHWHYTMYTLKILVLTISGSPQSWVLTTLLAITPKNGLTHTRPDQTPPNSRLYPARIPSILGSTNTPG